MAGFKYATTCEKPLPHFVNIAGRYKMNDNQIYKNRPEIGEALDRQVVSSREHYIYICPVIIMQQFGCRVTLTGKFDKAIGS